jgi:hypothetical protein
MNFIGKFAYLSEMLLVLPFLTGYVAGSSTLKNLKLGHRYSSLSRIPQILLIYEPEGLSDTQKILAHSIFLVFYNAICSITLKFITYEKNLSQ